jgi:hypothetical protein
MDNWYLYKFELRWGDKDPTVIEVEVVARHRGLAWMLAGERAGAYSPPVHSLTYVSNREVEVTDAEA